MTKEILQAMRALVVSKYKEYMEAEEKFWDGKDGFKNISLYKTFRKAKSSFHDAIQKWELALLDYINSLA